MFLACSGLLASLLSALRLPGGASQTLRDARPAVLLSAAAWPPVPSRHGAAWAPAGTGYKIQTAGGWSRLQGFDQPEACGDPASRRLTLLHGGSAVRLDGSNRIVLSRDLRRAAGIPRGQKLKVSATPGRVVLEVEPNPGKVVPRGKLKVWTGQVPSTPTEEAVDVVRHYER